MVEVLRAEPWSAAQEGPFFILYGQNKPCPCEGQYKGEGKVIMQTAK